MVLPSMIIVYGRWDEAAVNLLGLIQELKPNENLAKKSERASHR